MCTRFRTLLTEPIGTFIFSSNYLHRLLRYWCGLATNLRLEVLQAKHDAHLELGHRLHSLKHIHYAPSHQG